MKSKLATGIAMALMCFPVLAETGFYSGVSIGKFSAKDNVAGIELEGSDTGFKVFGGYRFSDYGSLEAAYIDGGTPDDTVRGVTIESDARAVQASALWQVPINPRFEAYVRASIIAWEADTSATNGFFLLTEETDGTDLGLGIGASVFVTPRFGLRVEFEGAEFDGTDVRLLSLSSLFIF